MWRVRQHTRVPEIKFFKMCLDFFSWCLRSTEKVLKMRLNTEHIYTIRDDSVEKTGNRKDRRKQQAIERRAEKKKKKLISQLRAVHGAS